MINNKTDLTCESCGSPVMVLQDEKGLRYECSYCGESYVDITKNEVESLVKDYDE